MAIPDQPRVPEPDTCTLLLVSSSYSPGPRTSSTSPNDPLTPKEIRTKEYPSRLKAACF